MKIKFEEVKKDIIEGKLIEKYPLGIARYLSIRQIEELSKLRKGFPSKKELPAICLKLEDKVEKDLLREALISSIIDSSSLIRLSDYRHPINIRDLRVEDSKDYYKNLRILYPLSPSREESELYKEFKIFLKNLKATHDFKLISKTLSIFMSSVFLDQEIETRFVKHLNFLNAFDDQDLEALYISLLLETDSDKYCQDVICLFYSRKFSEKEIEILRNLKDSIQYTLKSFSNLIFERKRYQKELEILLHNLERYNIFPKYVIEEDFIDRFSNSKLLSSLEEIDFDLKKKLIEKLPYNFKGPDTAQIIAHFENFGSRNLIFYLELLYLFNNENIEETLDKLLSKKTNIDQTALDFLNRHLNIFSNLSEKTKFKLLKNLSMSNLKINDISNFTKKLNFKNVDLLKQELMYKGLTPRFEITFKSARSDYFIKLSLFRLLAAVSYLDSIDDLITKAIEIYPENNNEGKLEKEDVPIFSDAVTFLYKNSRFFQREADKLNLKYIDKIKLIKRKKRLI